MDKANSIASIRSNIEKGYKLPHDIERTARDIYIFCGRSCDSDICKVLISLFLRSVEKSRFNNVFDITSDYLCRLTDSNEELLYEEFLKATHLYDSLNIFLYLGLNGGVRGIDVSQKCIQTLFLKYPKWAKRASLRKFENAHRDWWSEI